MNQRNSIVIMLGLQVAVMLFHVAILVGIIPYEITWGGRLKNDNEMYVFETLSLVINLFLSSILLIKGGYIKQLIPIKAVNIILWFFLVLFALNTVGNILAKTNFEKGFAVLTFLSCVFIWVILKGKGSNPSN